ncbi:hypothetical protein, unlikely [Trypanosoma brucei gambiense DAL972]|uniref:Uncharacterized protein n=1 Tax=Trypanosoma brucei gambiense (strain MHOM/CI/86/DAL972) TaxID=679716 RepID=C9ZX26_TRYB9|nr:hypothetical protein, unlikely [Trypanosoma brucei gambiense DAL972]CBH13967.1 hypothetical protein, unlikely [Trypanosoma brucei gambiense DAL972]|eukprot:XP_011776241.1 hypothetical protein, unlikely [Trypanosoma brucei gambiense DAL972]
MLLFFCYPSPVFFVLQVLLLCVCLFGSICPCLRNFTAKSVTEVEWIWIDDNLYIQLSLPGVRILEWDCVIGVSRGDECGSTRYIYIFFSKKKTLYASVLTSSEPS